MNGNPNTAQKRYHSELREMFGIGELHHIFGSKRKFKGHGQVGEWIVIMLSHEMHADINEFSFEQEKEMFFNQQAQYEVYYGKPSPVPKVVADIYAAMKHKQEVVKGIPLL
jgi:hypothetical protein